MTQYIGLDVGGTKIAAAAMVDGRLSPPVLQPTETSSSAALLDDLVGIIQSLRGPDAAAVGIGVPSVVEFATGRIRFSTNIPLVDLPLRRILSERVGLPVYVENDANCAALAEATEDGEVVCPDLVMITLGTGVGGGLVLNGRLYRGATGAAPELGHVIIGMDLRTGAPPPGERFPQAGSFERLAAGTELDRLAIAAATNAPESALGSELSEQGQVTGHDVVEAAQAGDARAIDVLRVLGERLGVGIANVINMFDPLEVVIGGGVSRAGDLLLGPAQETAKGYVLPGVGTACRIRLARRGVEAGVLGAALLAKLEHQHEGVTAVG